ncbi:MAG: helix-turn-helix transcriptional regulator [Hydrogenoanaerobacterium sp.]
MNYYERMRSLREEYHMSQRQLAAVLGMKQPQYQRYETGERDVPTPVLISLSTLYDVSVDYILGCSDNPKIEKCKFCPLDARGNLKTVQVNTK